MERSKRDLERELDARAIRILRDHRFETSFDTRRPADVVYYWVEKGVLPSTVLLELDTPPQQGQPETPPAVPTEQALPPAHEEAFLDETN